MSSAIDYLEGLKFELSKKELYGRVRELERKLACQVTLKNKAIKSRNKISNATPKALTVLIGVCNEGVAIMTDKEISERCFVSIKSVRDERYRMKLKERKDANT